MMELTLQRLGMGTSCGGSPRSRRGSEGPVGGSGHWEGLPPQPVSFVGRPPTTASPKPHSLANTRSAPRACPGVDSPPAVHLLRLLGVPRVCETHLEIIDTKKDH